MAFDNYKVFVDVYNGGAWTSFPDHIIDVTINWVNLGVRLMSPLADTITIEILEGQTSLRYQSIGNSLDPFVSYT